MMLGSRLSRRDLSDWFISGSGLVDSAERLRKHSDPGTCPGVGSPQAIGRRSPRPALPTHNQRGASGRHSHVLRMWLAELAPDILLSQLFARRFEYLGCFPISTR